MSELTQCVRVTLNENFPIQIGLQELGLSGSSEKCVEHFLSQGNGHIHFAVITCFMHLSCIYRFVDLGTSIVGLIS